MSTSKIEPPKKEETDKIISENDSDQNWDKVKAQMIKQAEIEIKNKAKNIQDSTNLYKIINILINHIEKIPNFFDECKTEERKKEVKKEIREKAIITAKEYYDKKEEQENVDKVKQNISLEELIKEINQQIEKMEKEKKKRAEMEQLMKKEIEEYKKRELEKRKIYSENESKKKDEKCHSLEEEIQKGIERRKKEEEKIWRDRGFNCTACQRYFQQQRDERYIDDLVTRTMRGEFGPADARRARLGSLYPIVQKRIKERLGISKRDS